MSFTYHKDGIVPVRLCNVVFVFGSNLAGRHGAGAALVAHEEFGAEYGIGEGLIGSSYAIPTKDKHLKTRSLKEIEKSVKDFLKYVRHSDHQVQFFVTRIGCGLAGFKDSEIAPLFQHAEGNLSFAEQWRPYLE